jgi:alpha-galactosidase
MGYYKLLDRIRNSYPEVIIENCSSGGLRMDLGILKRTHVSHLSDPDYTENHLQVFWGATTMLHPSICLHFTWSQSLYELNIIKEPIAEDMPVHTFDYYIRSAMMGVLGFSYRLPQFPLWCMERLKQHIEFYKSISQKFIKEADFYHLTAQAIRNGSGDRWNAFLYVTEDKKDGLIFVFRLAGGEKERVIKLKGLEKGGVYKVLYKDRNLCTEMTSLELTEKGLEFKSIEEEGSEIVILEKKTQEVK